MWQWCSAAHANPPLCDIPSGGCFFTGPWTVTRSSLRMLRRVPPLPPPNAVAAEKLSLGRGRPLERLLQTPTFGRGLQGPYKANPHPTASRGALSGDHLFSSARGTGAAGQADGGRTAWAPPSRLAASVCQLRHDRMEEGPTEPHTGRSTFLLSSGGAGGRALLNGR